MYDPDGMIHFVIKAEKMKNKMSKDFGEIYVSKDFPESEPLSKLLNAVFEINKVEFNQSQFGDLAFVTIGDNLYRTSSSVLIEQLVFVKRSIEDNKVMVRCKLVEKPSFTGRKYQCFTTAVVK